MADNEKVNVMVIRRRLHWLGHLECLDMLLTSQNTFWVESAQLTALTKVLSWGPEDEMV